MRKMKNMWDLVSKITSVIFGLSTIYFYLEKRKFQSFEFDKEARIKEVELEESELQKNDIIFGISSYGYLPGPERERRMNDLEFKIL